MLVNSINHVKTPRVQAAIYREMDCTRPKQRARKECLVSVVRASETPSSCWLARHPHFAFLVFSLRISEHRGRLPSCRALVAFLPWTAIFCMASLRSSSLLPSGAFDPELSCCVVETSVSIPSCCAGCGGPESIAATVGAELSSMAGTVLC